MGGEDARANVVSVKVVSVNVVSRCEGGES